MHRKPQKVFTSRCVCGTIITESLDDRQFKTKGFESDQQAAAITATLKMLNLIER